MFRIICNNEINVLKMSHNTSNRSQKFVWRLLDETRKKKKMEHKINISVKKFPIKNMVGTVKVKKKPKILTWNRDISRLKIIMRIIKFANCDFWSKITFYPKKNSHSKTSIKILNFYCKKSFLSLKNPNQCFEPTQRQQFTVIC
jgi:hypothetical protein